MIRRRQLRLPQSATFWGYTGKEMRLLHWSSFPVIVLEAWVLIELLPLFLPRARQNRLWIIVCWFMRPLAVWAVYNIVIRLIPDWGFHNRTTYPFYLDRDGRERWRAAFLRLALNLETWRWSVVVWLLGTLAVIFARWIATEAIQGFRIPLALAYLWGLGFLLPLAYDTLPEGVIAPLEHQGSFLHMWFDVGNTMLYCMPKIGSVNHYLRHFEELQPELRMTIHGASHPPGASLALYWLGKLLGASERIGTDRLRYALAHTLFAAFSGPAMFALGRCLRVSRRISLMAALLWTVKPATIIWNSFAADAVYVVFDILTLALIARVATAPSRPWIDMFGLGLLLYALMMLNFNWPLFAAIFGLFVLAEAYRRKLVFRDWFLRGLIPMALAGALLLWTCRKYDLNYVAIFRYALEYTRRFYRAKTAGRWIMSLLGSPLDLAILSGSVAAYVFWRFLRQIRSARAPASAKLLLGLTLCAYGLSILSVNALKQESSRIWAWVTSLPMVMVALQLSNYDHPRFYFTAALVASLLQCYAIKLFLVASG